MLKHLSKTSANTTVKIQTILAPVQGLSRLCCNSGVSLMSSPLECREDSKPQDQNCGAPSPIRRFQEPATGPRVEKMFSSHLGAGVLPGNRQGFRFNVGRHYLGVLYLKGQAYGYSTTSCADIQYSWRNR
jgi:hypothetical protein